MSDVELRGDTLDADEARELIDGIKTRVADVWRSVTIAYTGRAWVSLGYPSWDSMCETEFDGARIRLPREERTEVIGSLREAGMSIRAITAATGLATNTVRSQLSQIDTPTAVTGKDGKSYPATRPTPVVADDGDPWDDTIAPDSPADMTAGVEPVGASVPPAPSSEHRQGGTEATPADEVDGYLDALVSPSVEDLFDARLNRWLGQVNDCRLLSPAETAEALSRHDDWWRRFTVIRADVDRWFATVDAARPPRLRSVGGTR